MRHVDTLYYALDTIAASAVDCDGRRDVASLMLLVNELEVVARAAMKAVPQ